MGRAVRMGRLGITNAHHRQEEHTQKVPSVHVSSPEELNEQSVDLIRHIVLDPVTGVWNAFNPQIRRPLAEPI
jgi:hypothetical protein